MFIVEQYISTFYGNYFDSPEEFNLTMFDNLDLGEFFLSTRPEVVILRCQINMQKCPQPTQVLTRYGWCSFYKFNGSGEGFTNQINLDLISLVILFSPE